MSVSLAFENRKPKTENRKLYTYSEGILLLKVFS